jgi:hypothetical protein
VQELSRARDIGLALLSLSRHVPDHNARWGHIGPTDLLIELVDHDGLVLIGHYPRRRVSECVARSRSSGTVCEVLQMLELKL